MKQRFRARELWLFVPFLLVGVAALLYWRWEAVTPADKRGLYVAKIARTPATAWEASNDTSHHLTVTLAHGWPRPLWWGEVPQEPYSLDPLHPKKPAVLYYGAQSDRSFASGGVATGIRGGKEVVFGDQTTPWPGIITFDGTNYQIKHDLSLRGAYAGAGEVIFKGLYQFKNREPVEAQKVVRTKEEQFPPLDKNPGMRVVSIEFAPWTKEEIIEMNGTLTTTDELFMSVVVEPTTPVPAGKTNHQLSGNVTNVSDNVIGDFPYSMYEGMESEAPKITLKPGQLRQIFHFAVDVKEKTRGRLYGYGRLWMDERWPIPFELKLPPRPAAAAAAK